jgi:hypothetical protein
VLCHFVVHPPVIMLCIFAHVYTHSLTHTLTHMTLRNSVYNFCGLAVTKSLSAVHRTLIDACRTVLVWCVDLLIRYAFHQHAYGEAWTKWSFLELGGFVVLFLGTLVYNHILV